VKLHASGPSGVNTITGYGEGYVVVNGERRDSSLVVLPDRIESWQVSQFEGLTESDFVFLKNLAPRSSCLAPARGSAFRIRASPRRSRKRESGSR
jgi:uncharacterized protein